MQNFTDVDSARQWVYQRRAIGKTVGIVPTMGALHEGHLSLARKSRQQCDCTVATIFVNPTQFGPEEDLQKYPRTLRQDCQLLSDAGVDAVFLPHSADMYPDGFSTFVDPPAVAATLEGVCRPDHFRGVATIVLKLFQIIPATHAFFGRKDYQQLKVIQAMARDLNLGIQIVPGETVREADGLALSSRNRYLNDADRQRALLLSKALQATQRAFESGQRDAETLQVLMQACLRGRQETHDNSTADDLPTDDSAANNLPTDKLAARGVDKIDYAVVVDAGTLTPISNIHQSAVALIAAYVGKTRLIDNVILHVEDTTEINRRVF